MKNGITPEFIARIPKTDLHVHLDGSIRPDTLLDLAEKEHIQLPADTPEGLRETVFKTKYADLREYLQGFAYTCAVLSCEENIRRVAYELARDNIAEGVRYIEVRYAPQLLASDRLSVEDSMRAVCEGMDQAKAEHNATVTPDAAEDMPFEYGIIICAMRRFNRNMGTHFAKLLSVLSMAPRREIYALASLEMVRAAVSARDEHGWPIVGFDLAGEEAGYPAWYHCDAYQYAHSHFLKKTVHAGEAYGPESIFQAITECHANRIGHGTFLFRSSMVRDSAVKDPEAYVELIGDYIATQRITIEVCPTSNLQTIPAITCIHDHSLVQMLEHDLSVSICTDNRLVSNTTVTDELKLVAGQLDVSRKQFRNMISAGFKGSFFPGRYTDKRAFVRRALGRYARLEHTMLNHHAERRAVADEPRAFETEGDPSCEPSVLR